MATGTSWGKWVASMGVGLWPGPQGTYGSAVVAGAAALWLAAGGAALAGPWYAALVLATTALALWATHAALEARVFGPDKDPGQVVIDEAAGQLVAMYGIAAVGWELAAAFLLFRVFDILKPFPAGWSQGLPGTWGVVIDDLFAGLYALLAVRLLA